MLDPRPTCPVPLSVECLFRLRGLCCHSLCDGRSCPAWKVSAEEFRALSAAANPRLETGGDAKFRHSVLTWEPWEEALLGQVPDAHVVQQTGRTLVAVRCRRRVLGILLRVGNGR